MTEPQSGEKLQKLELADKADKFTMNGLKIKLVLSLIFLFAAFVTWAIITLRTPHHAKPHKFKEPVIVETFEPVPDINPDVTEILRIPSILADSEDYVVHGVNCSIPYVPIQGKVLRKLWNPHSMEIPVCRTDPSGILSTFYTDSEELEIYNLENFKSCCYREIRRPVTPQGDTYELSELCTPYKDRTKLHGVEYFFIQCKTKPSSQYRGGIRYRFHANIPKKDNVLLKEHFWKDGFQNGNEVPVSVSILILDSVSRIHAYRTLPKTMTYLLENLNFVDFRGHHILGEPTMPNVIPLLLGEPSAEHFWNHTKPDWTSQWDPYPFIWKPFSSLNYVTFFSEDNARISTFNYGDQRGFLEPPTDYYTRPLFAALEDGMFSSMPSHGACFGNETASQFSLNHHLHFLKKMQPTPTFSLNRLTVPQHDVMEASATLDAPLLNYFKKLSSSKSIMQNTVFILMSDHGFWSNPYARTYEGLLERRLPFLLVRLPEKLLRKHPEYLSALEKNANSVTSHHDVHETLLHLITLTSGKKGKARKKTSPQTSPYRHSLLKPLPSPRSCKEANIPRHICTCKLPIPDDNPEFIHAFLPNRLRLPSPMKGAMPFYS